MKLDFLKKNSETLYVVFRVLVGFMFFQHGAQKLLGWFGGNGGAALVSMMGLAGVIELIGGLAILLGFFSRLAAVGGTLVMLGALVTVHFPKGWNPLANMGEPALLYLAAFLVVMAYGNGKWSVEKSLLKKEMF